MASFNRVILAGNLTRDPELAYTASNTPICKFGMAMNRKWRDKNTGENRENVCFVDCTAFGRSAEVINQYMSKGQPMLVEGHLNFGQWEDQSGNKRSKLDVVVDNFQFLGGPRPQEGAQPAQAAAPGSAPAPPPDPGSPVPSDDYGPPVDDSGVPF